MKYHRHTKKWATLQEGIDQMKEFGPQWHTRGPFIYCEICKCVPASYIGKEEDNGSPLSERIG